MPLTFKIASEPWELDQIHRLNYRTFVNEIPQHRPNEAGVLVDRFHADNVYFVALHGRTVVGMVALRCRRPFSLDQKLPDLDAHLPPGRRQIAEVRLLAADPAHRGGRVFVGLLAAAGRHLVANHFDLAIASGTTRQQKLYRHLGWTPFGPLVGTPGALYQPMYQTRERFEETARDIALPLDHKAYDDGGECRENARCGEPPPQAVSFLPGPVDVSEAVRRATSAPAVSHRSDQFLADVRATRRQLCNLVNAPHAQILAGSGTQANDLVAAQLSLTPGRGLILTNGEFGDRLTDHARRFGLPFDVARQAPGRPFDSLAIDRALAGRAAPAWLWAVHCETSTGVLNDLPALVAHCGRGATRLAVDCVSSIGTIPVDLAGVDFATGVSGKGVAAAPGLGLVFHAAEAHPSDRLPRSLDLGQYAAAPSGGIPYTLPSNLLYALKASLDDLRPADRFAAIVRHARRVRDALADIGLTPVAPEPHASPAVLTLALPSDLSSTRIGDALTAAGHALAYKSDYLLARNHLQICLMSHHYPAHAINRMLRALRRQVSPARPAHR
jgi:aspartate aminotransferase-like enzyme